MRLFLFSLVVSALLVGSVAFSAEGKFDSLEGRTQLEAAGQAIYSKNSDLAWVAQAAGFHYIMPHFGIGGMAGLGGYSGSELYYAFGPAAEYFIPVADRAHVFFQGMLGLSGYSKSESALTLKASGGYRYFVTDDIALSVKLEQSWQKSTSSGGGLNSAGGLNLLVGFSLFF